MGAYSPGPADRRAVLGRLSDRVGRKPDPDRRTDRRRRLLYICLRTRREPMIHAARLFGGLMAGGCRRGVSRRLPISPTIAPARATWRRASSALRWALASSPAWRWALLIGDEPGRVAFTKVCYASAALAGLAALAALVLFKEMLRRAAEANTLERPRMRMLMTRPVLARFIVVMFPMIAAQALMESTFGLWA
ncbi:MAG: hypothetical protein R3C16_13760 [Hyphomonadaceae bacterium]